MEFYDVWRDLCAARSAIVLPRMRWSIPLMVTANDLTTREILAKVSTYLFSATFCEYVDAGRIVSGYLCPDTQSGCEFKTMYSNSLRSVFWENESYCNARAPALRTGYPVSRHSIERPLAKKAAACRQLQACKSSNLSARSIALHSSHRSTRN